MLRGPGSTGTTFLWPRNNSWFRCASGWLGSTVPLAHLLQIKHARIDEREDSDDDKYQHGRGRSAPQALTANKHVLGIDRDRHRVGRGPFHDGHQVIDPERVHSPEDECDEQGGLEQRKSQIKEL